MAASADDGQPSEKWSGNTTKALFIVEKSQAGVNEGEEGQSIEARHKEKNSEWKHVEEWRAAPLRSRGRVLRMRTVLRSTTPTKYINRRLRVARARSKPPRVRGREGGRERERERGPGERVGAVGGERESVTPTRAGRE
jgi:hypothetical protein